MKIIDYFKLKELKRQKEIMMYHKTGWLAAKFAITAIAWFYSSIVVMPIYFVIIEPLVIRPKTWFLEGLSFYGGAIAWFAIIYLLLSILMWWWKIRRKL
ncbi:hypothetical protein AYK26_04090 [Euryarchaeota archaeon SM23-78]|nr:MAG: hypothetical protein AYK26_04090 [Euryarchaeota archaeon SM23-78]MBW3000963.1 hypothetical protein [Candidatus Woesearchaeota archaeon]